MIKSPDLRRERSRATTALGAAVVLVVLTMLCGSAAPVGAQGFRLIANQSFPLDSLTSAQTEQIFLKQRSELPDGRTAQPIEQSRDSQVRRAFWLSGLKRTPESIEQYWQRTIFSGRGLPPPARAGDDAIAAFVRANRSAIGYVSATYVLPAGVKLVALVP